MLQIYEQQTAHRDDLRREAKELVQQIAAGGNGNPVADDLLRKLAEKLVAHKGKKVYGYLNQPARNVVNAIVDELAKDDHIAQLYGLWYEQRETVLATYRSEMPERLPLSQNSEFKTIKNAVIAEAAKLLLVQKQGTQPSEQQQVGPQSGVSDVALGSMRLLGQLSRIIENKIDDSPKQVQVDSKLWREEQAKKAGLGLK